MNRTLAEQMAIEVLKGDMVAARALADKLKEEEAPLPEFSPYGPGHAVVTGFEMFQWPEFIAFATRLGFKWDLMTVGFSISCDGPDDTVDVRQHYHGSDRS